MPEKYRKRPVTVEAMRFTGGAQELYEVYHWVETHVGSYSSIKEGYQIPAEGISIDHYTGDLLLVTLEGEMRCKYGDWVVRGVKGEFYPCKDDVFRLTYERVPEPEKDEIPGMIEQVRQTYEKPMSQYEEMVNAIEMVNMRKKRDINGS